MFCCVLVGCRTVGVLLFAGRGWFVLLRVCAVKSCSIVLYVGVVNFSVDVVGWSGCVGEISARVIACCGLLLLICGRNEC